MDDADVPKWHEMKCEKVEKKVTNSGVRRCGSLDVESGNYLQINTIPRIMENIVSENSQLDDRPGPQELWKQRYRRLFLGDNHRQSDVTLAGTLARMIQIRIDPAYFEKGCGRPYGTKPITGYGQSYSRVSRLIITRMLKSDSGTISGRPGATSSRCNLLENRWTAAPS